MTDSLAVNMTKKLIAIESTDPGAFEGALGDYLEQWLSKLPGVRLTRAEALPGRSNLMAELPGDSADGTALVFLCHMDTVVAGDGWSLPPFKATERDGRIYGRGACDMKSGLSCCLSAFAWAAGEQAESRLPRKHTLKLVCTVDEEDFMRGVEACIRDGWIKKDDWLLDAEPTGGKIQAAHKGRIWYEIQANGRTAHASTPWKGADAIAAMAEIIRGIRLAVRELPVHPALGPSTVTFGQIVGGYRPYVVPDKCRVWVDIRIAPPLDEAMADRIVCEAVSLAQKEISGITASRCVTGSRPSIEMDESSPLLAALREACLDAVGEPPATGVFPGYTDTAVAAGTLKNHNAMSYGPGQLECAHKPDEWVEIADILRCEQVFRRLAQNFLSRDSD